MRPAAGSGMRMPAPMDHHLLAQLAARIGLHQARQEFRWMRNSIPLLQRRLRGEPLQYILGIQPFGPLNLLVRPPVLIPRPETEHWAIALAHSLHPHPHRPLALLDIGTGSGCIPLLLCHLWPHASVHAHAVDISPHAIQLATDNASLCNIPTASTTRNTFNTTLANCLSPTFAAHLAPPFDVVTSNPPYISWSEFQQLPPCVADHEDPKALFGGPSGLDFYHAIARLVRQRGFLSHNALVALEVGDGQAETVADLMHSGAQMRTEIWSDPWGKQRTVVARTA